MNTALLLSHNVLVIGRGRPTKSRDLTKIHRIMGTLLSDGLLNPLHVARRKNKFVIIDGNKRFHAIRVLKRRGQLKRSLERIPCVLIEKEEPFARGPQSLNKPVLLSDLELSRRIQEGLGQGVSAQLLSDKYFCPLSVIEQVRNLKCLDARVMAAFETQAIKLEQAAALATLPNKTSQWLLLKKLGPFAGALDIIDAISNGDTVVNLPDGDVLILPTRAPGAVDIFRFAA